MKKLILIFLFLAFAVSASSQVYTKLPKSGLDSVRGINQLGTFDSTINIIDSVFLRYLPDSSVLFIANNKKVTHDSADFKYSSVLNTLYTDTGRFEGIYINGNLINGDTPTLNATIIKGQYPVNNFLDLANILNPDYSKRMLRAYNAYEDTIMNGSTGNRYMRTPCVYMYRDTMYVNFVTGNRHAPTQGGHRQIIMAKDIDGRYSKIISDRLIPVNSQAINYSLFGDTVFAWKKGMTTFTIDSLIKLNPRTLARIGTAIAFNHASVFLPTSVIAPGKFELDDSGYFYAPVYKTSPRYVAYLLRSKNRGQTWELADSITSTVNVIRAEEPFVLQIKGDTLMWGVRSDVGNYIWTKKGFRGYNFTANYRACKGGNLPKAILSSTDSLIILAPSRWITKRSNQDEELVEINDTIDVGEFPAEVQTEDVTQYTNIEISWDNGITYYNFPLDKFRSEHSISSQFASLWISEGADVVQLARDTFRIVFCAGAFESSSAVNQISDLSYTDFVVNPRQAGVVKILGGESAPRTTYYTNINAKTVTIKDTANFTNTTQTLSNRAFTWGGNFQSFIIPTKRLFALNSSSVANFYTMEIRDTIDRERFLLLGGNMKYQHASQGGAIRMFTYGGTISSPTPTLDGATSEFSMGGRDSSNERSNFTFVNTAVGDWSSATQTSHFQMRKTKVGSGQNSFTTFYIDNQNRTWIGDTTSAPTGLSYQFQVRGTAAIRGGAFTVEQTSQSTNGTDSFFVKAPGGELKVVSPSVIKAIAKAYVDSSTGGISYMDTGVNAINTRAYTGGIIYTLRFDSLKTVVYDLEKPLGVDRFFRFSDTTIRVDSAMWIDVLLYFKAQTSVLNQEIDVWIDIGSPVGELYRQTYYFRGTGVDKAVTYALPSAYARSTFFANGGKIKIYSASNFTLTSPVNLNIDLDHRRLKTP